MSTTATTTTSPSSTSVEQQILHLIQNPAPLQESEVEKLYNKLKPLPSREFLFGSWKGGAFETGHKGYEELKKTKWAGKDFKGVDDVDPIIVYNEKGEREKGEEWGGASLREMVFRGVTSTAMIYDKLPVVDHFRYLNEDIVVGAMDCPKYMEPDKTFYFYLTKRKV